MSLLLAWLDYSIRPQGACGKLTRNPSSLREAYVKFAEFWPAYVRAHSRPATRLVHLAGTLAGWMLVGAAIAERRWWWVVLALVVSYGLAWISHFFVERNMPATFEHPLWSWWADQRMVFLMITGQMGKEVKRYAGSQAAVN